MYPVDMMEMIIYLSCIFHDKYLKMIQRDKKDAWKENKSAGT